jgi:hypothetical protein
MGATAYGGTEVRMGDVRIDQPGNAIAR